MENAPAIVFDDADEITQKSYLLPNFCNSGQTCICTNRIYVQSGVCNTFRKIWWQMEQIKLGVFAKNKVLMIDLSISESAVQKNNTNSYSMMQSQK